MHKEFKNVVLDGRDSWTSFDHLWLCPSLIRTVKRKMQTRTDRHLGYLQDATTTVQHMHVGLV